MSPVFMIGTQRSGSNLLRLMLNQLDEMASPHPPHILERMYPLLSVYGDLNDEKCFKLLIDDVCRLVELNPVEWSGVILDRNEIFKRSTERSLISVYGAVYDVYAEVTGATTWCCKSLSNVNYLNEIQNHFDNPKFIYLYRDGRDVALSFQRAVVGEKHIYHIAKEWSDTQNKALELKDKVPDELFFAVSYEQLICQTVETTMSLCDFLKVEFKNSMLEFHKSSEARLASKSSDLWSNVSNPIMQNNFKKYKSQMSLKDLRVFESIAGSAMDKLGYQRDIIMPGKEDIYSEQEIMLFEEMNSAMKFNVLNSVDASDKERRERQARLLVEIKSRVSA